ncbi:sensor domain-containing diguanylate cyclase [Acidithiobacillus thiooxidans]|uniref:sensor domain-containing diguanylate cyclase n=1 Tax=Acidithiobacillus thiooxidans TaxID=930 RepID=UPI00068BEF20|nr:sensor domain-containing diguanylate cyclase [Acidithiobacillus thiooxidans]
MLHFKLETAIKHIISVSSLIEIAGHTLVLAAATELSEEMGHEISQSEQNFQRLFENMLDVFYRTDSEQNLTLVGPAALGVLGYLPEEVIGLPASSFYFDPQARANIVTAVKKHGKVQNFPARLKHKDGHIVDVEITSSAIYSEDKQFLGMEGLFRDVSEQVVIKEKLHRLATIDELTGILNRRAFLEKANHLIKHLRRQPEYSLLAVIDLDKFKPINDRYGHLSGDRVLKVFVSLFKETLRETDVFGRLGGDEFAIIFRKCTMTEGLEILERIQEKMQKISIRLSDNEVSISASIGLTELHEEDLPFSLALARADRALYQAKQNGGAHVAMLLS